MDVRQLWESNYFFYSDIPFKRWAVQRTVAVLGAWEPRRDINQSPRASTAVESRPTTAKNYRQEWTARAHWWTSRGKTPASMKHIRELVCESLIFQWRTCVRPTTAPAWQWPKWSAGALSSVSARLSTRRLSERCHDALVDLLLPPFLCDLYWDIMCIMQWVNTGRGAVHVHRRLFACGWTF